MLTVHLANFLQVLVVISNLSYRFKPSYVKLCFYSYLHMSSLLMSACITLSGADEVGWNALSRHCTGLLD